MAANNALKITDINFDAIKANLRDYLSSQNELQDYDYDSSTIQTILNLLAYNTYYNSFYLNMVANEMYLDSALIRSNVVSRAKQVGYTPRSARGATATISVTVTPDDSPDTVIIPADTQFTSVLDDVTYTFSTLDSFALVPSGVTFVGNIDIVEGNRVQESYTVNSNNPSRYLINNDNADTTTLVVSVQESSSNTSTTTYSLASTLNSLTPSSEVYFLSEVEEEKFEVYFGDGIIGKAPRDGNIIKLNYNVVNGSTVNNANNFVAASTIAGYDSFTTSLVTRAQGGAEIESIDSIKFNAPSQFTVQNRAVTAEDFKSLVTSNFGDLSTVNAFGGDELSPPVYGKVYIVAKPTSGLILSDTTKDAIVTFLNTKKTLTIEPVIIDATYIFVQTEVLVKFTPDETTRSTNQLAEAVKNALLNYESTELGLFTQNFIESELIKDIDAVDSAITSVQTDIKLERRLVPEVNSSRTYNIPFNHELLNISGGVILSITPEAHPGQGLTLTSSSFTYDGQTGVQMDDDGFGNVRFFTRSSVTGIKSYLTRRAGTIDYTTGLITLNSINFEAFVGDYISIFVVPEEKDVEPSRNQLVLLTDSKVTVFDNKIGRNTAIISNIQTAGDTAESSDYGSSFALI